LDLFIGDHYYKDEKGYVYEIEHGATTTIENFDFQTKPTAVERLQSFLGVFKVFANVDVYVGAGDGRIKRDDSSTTFLNCRNATDGTAVEDNVVSNETYIWRSAPRWIFKRSWFPVDTSSVPDTATIDSAVFHYYGAAVNDNDDDEYG